MKYRIILCLGLFLCVNHSYSQDMKQEQGWVDLTFDNVMMGDTCVSPCSRQGTSGFDRMEINSHILLATGCAIVDSYLLEILDRKEFEMFYVPYSMWHFFRFRPILRPTVSITLYDSSLCEHEECNGWWCYNPYRGYTGMLAQFNSPSLGRVTQNGERASQHEYFRRIVIDNGTDDLIVRQHVIISEDTILNADCVLQSVNVADEVRLGLNICFELFSGNMSFPSLLDEGITK